mmetsp:Transcript_20898/g.25348  ORF Transcript_20898/g.25348 Transcript_20898/m.25348 type:complete len:122 (+) Transcript_20898:1057-1422(+)
MFGCKRLRFRLPCRIWDLLVKPVGLTSYSQFLPKTRMITPVLSRKEKKPRSINNRLNNVLHIDFRPDAVLDEKLNLLNDANTDLGFKFRFWRNLKNISETNVCDVNSYDLALYSNLVMTRE